MHNEVQIRRNIRFLRRYLLLIYDGGWNDTLIELGNAFAIATGSVCSFLLALKFMRN